MRIQWHGQSAFTLTTPDATVVIDPFGDLSGLASHGVTIDYPPIETIAADLLLVTHEHADHNGIEVVGGDPLILRSTAGRLDSPIGEVVAIASEHDQVAGTERGPNTIFCFELAGLRICHFGDFGQRGLREEQAAAIGDVDLLFLPVGGGPTIDGAAATVIVEHLEPRWVVPMHYRTARTNFLETEEAFVERATHAERLEVSEFDPAAIAAAGGPVVVIPAAP